MDDNSRTNRGGEEWYKLQAYRSVNQAIGRVIRHMNDYGAILFCDERYTQKNAQDQLSKWLRPSIKNYVIILLTLVSFNDANDALSKFFKQKSRENGTFIGK